MWILMVEAGVALFLLVFIVWWTMYSGPKPTPPVPEKLEHDKPVALEQDKPAAPDAADKT